MTTQATPISRAVARGQVRPGGGPAAARQNVGETERVVSLGVGGLMVLAGLTQRGWGGAALGLLGVPLAYRGLTGHCSCYQAVGVDTNRRAAATSVRAGHGYKVEAAVTVNRPAADVYRFWRRLDNLPRIMDELKEVRPINSNRSHWVARGPAGYEAEWDAEVINERENELIAWRSVGGDVETAGSVHFTPAPGGRGTEVRVSLKYDPPGGKVGASLAWLAGGNPAERLRDALRRLKQLLEAGELATAGNGRPARHN